MKGQKALAFIAILLIAVGLTGYKIATSPSEVIPDEKPVATERPIRTLTVTATGDCTFATDVNASRELGFVAYAERYGTDWFFQNVRDIFDEDDLTIVNFEGTLSDRGEREIKQFAFRGDPEYVNALTGVEAVNLANNHSMDYGEISLDDTKKYLDEKGIVYCRGKADVAVEEINGIKVGLVGINYLNDVMRTELVDAIDKAKDKGAELIILSIHWGVEKATAPNQDQIDAAYTAIDNGVDLVIGTHPHVLQGFEKYKGKYICYSLGNFSFGGNNAPSDMDTAIFRKTFTIQGDKLLDDDAIEIIPCRISSADGYNNYQPTPATGQQRQRIIDRLTSYTENLGDLELNFR